MEMEPSGPIRSDIDESESDMGSSPRNEMAEVIVEVRWLAHALGQAFDAGRESVKLAEADYPEAREAETDGRRLH
jgi:hypothetical protein